ncbi:MAG TPA: ABC transporter ATP-binding protein [Acidobacteriota bacterium]|nr:ABC transporter ATP-binding protein [Acidobacteriota bacterium]
MSKTIVSVRGFRKRYGETLAVKGISFEVREGEIFALLGPNGSGKTSTLESLEGLRHPDGGSLSIAGIDPSRQVRKLQGIIGVQLQTSALPAAMTVDEAMNFFSSYHGVAARNDLAERLGLEEKRHTQYVNLSVGQQKRLAFIIAIAHEPQVLFLDEPTAGLDVRSRTDLHVLIGDLRQKGTTVILATHDMAEAQKLADRAAILLRGEIAAMGSPRQLTAAGNRLTRISVGTENGSLLGRAIEVPGGVAKGCENGYALFVSESPGTAVSAILDWIERAGDTLCDLRVERPTLEERFLEITSENSRKGAEV